MSFSIKYWNKNSTDYKFRFIPNEKYNVYINYQENDNPRIEKFLMELKIYDKVGMLNKSGQKWDYFPIDPPINI